MLSIILMIVISGLVGWLASFITGEDLPFGVIGYILVGILGSWLGQLLFGKWGPVFGNIYIIQALLIAIMIAIIIGALLKLFF